MKKFLNRKTKGSDREAAASTSGSIFPDFVRLDKKFNAEKDLICQKYSPNAENNNADRPDEFGEKTCLKIDTRKIGLDFRFFRFLVLLLPVLFLISAGCGTTKWTDTSRTGTEQLLITSAIDDVVDEIDFYPLSGRKVFIKKEGINCSDSVYLFSVLRQQLAANGVFVRDKEEEAEYVLEVAPGAVGTDRYDLIYGISSTNVPSVLTGGVATSIPEVSFVKRTDQKAEVKLMLWAYNKKSGAIIWQSGRKTKTAYIRNRWILGIGPITKSSFNNKIIVSGDEVKVKNSKFGEIVAGNERPSVKTEAVYREVDQKSLERLEEIRKEGSYRYTRRTDQKDKKQNTAVSESKPDMKTAAVPVSGSNGKSAAQAVPIPNEQRNTLSGNAPPGSSFDPARTAVNPEIPPVR